MNITHKVVSIIINEAIYEERTKLINKEFCHCSRISLPLCQLMTFISFIFVLFSIFYLSRNGCVSDNLKVIAYNSNMTSFFRFVDNRVIYRWYNLIRTCAGECDCLFHWQYILCATFSASVNINYRLPIKVYYRICTLRHIRIEINHGSQNVFEV